MPSRVLESAQCCSAFMYAAHSAAVRVASVPGFITWLSDGLAMWPKPSGKATLAAAGSNAPCAFSTRLLSSAMPTSC